MASHVPFLAVRPDQEDSADVTARDFATSTGSKTGSRRGASKTVAGSAKNTVKKAEQGVKNTAHRATRAGMPQFFRFSAILISSLVLRLVLYTVISQWAGIELASVSRDLKQDWQIAAVVTWKVLELIGVWWLEYGWVDIASLALLSNLPYYFLLSSFFQLSAGSVVTSLGVDIVSLVLPFLLFNSHIASSRDEDLLRPVGRAVAHDWQILTLSSALATIVFALPLSTSFATWIPLHMIRHFDNLRSLDVIHDYTLLQLAPLFVPAGLAAMHFLFLPIVSASNSLLSALDSVTEDAPFDPEEATLLQTIAYNFGLKNTLSAKTEVLLKRTAILALGSAMNTFIRVFATIDGAEASGALGWAGLWAASIAVVGLVFRWVSE